MKWSNMQPSQVPRWSLPWGLIFWAIILLIAFWR